jgi:transcriptional regulator with XRE-family HTH domain
MYAKLSQQIGTHVRAARHRAGLSQAQVAEAIHVPTLVFSRLERGRLLYPASPRWWTCAVFSVSPWTSFWEVGAWRFPLPMGPGSRGGATR